MQSRPHNLAILGVTEYCKVAAEIAEQLGWEVHLFDEEYKGAKEIGHWPIKGNESDLKKHGKKYDGVFVVNSDNRQRKEQMQHLKLQKFKIATLISPYATVSENATIGKGTIVMPNATINYGTKIEEGCIINTGAIVDFDCTIHSYVHISPGANVAAEITIGDFSWIGIGSSIIHDLTVGHDVVVGAGAVIINDIPDGVTAVGCPARIVSRIRTR